MNDLLPEVRIIVLLKDRIRKLEAALLRVQHGLESRDWEDNRSEIIDYIINTVHASRAQSEPPIAQSKSQQKRFDALTSVEPVANAGQLCHLCNAVHDLMSACPPSYLAKMSSAESLPCENCGHSVDEHFGIGLPCPTNDRGVAK